MMMISWWDEQTMGLMYGLVMLFIIIWPYDHGDNIMMRWTDSGPNVWNYDCYDDDDDGEYDDDDIMLGWTVNGHNVWVS